MVAQKQNKRSQFLKWRLQKRNAGRTFVNDECSFINTGRTWKWIVFFYQQQDNGVADENIVGSLEKTFLKSMISKCTNDGRIKTIHKSMTELYKHDASLIQVIGNYQLNSYLETLARLFCPYICRVNKHVSDAIKQTFPSY